MGLKDVRGIIETDGVKEGENVNSMTDKAITLLLPDFLNGNESELVNHQYFV